MRRYFERYCKDYKNIENYDRAATDNFKGWHCHHRLETHTSDGERRLVDITQKELMALNMYYNRPAKELIFLTSREHNAYGKGKKRSDETRRKMAEAKKGENHPNYGKQGYWKGKKLSEEHKKKLSEAGKGKPKSEETKKKLSEAAKGNTNVRGRHWFNNGKINKRAKECPDGFVPGRLR